MNLYRNESEGAGFGGFYLAQGFDENGKWVFDAYIRNRIVAQGLDYQLSVGLAAGTQITPWYVGLTDSLPTDAPGDTLASHPGWVEVTDYTGSRQVWTPDAVAGQSVSNSTSKAIFPITQNGTVIGGAFLSEVATGAAGLLYSVGAFTGGDETLNAGSTLEVTGLFTSQTL